MRTKTTVAVSMAAEDKKAVEIVAQKTGLSFSAAVRMLIRFGLEAWKFQEDVKHGK